MKKIILVITCSLLINTSNAQVLGGSVTKADSLILVDLYNSNPKSLIHRSIDSINGWDLTKPITTWGVLYKNGGNTWWDHIDLRKMNIDSIPPSLGNLKGFLSLDFSSNNIKQLPDNLGNIVLASQNGQGNLAFNGNKLTSIPKTFGNIKNLKHLSLSSNPLTDLPHELGNIEILNGFSIGLVNNSLKSIPLCLANLKSINGANIHITLYLNDITEIPEEFTHMVGRIFTITNNKLNKVKIPLDLCHKKYNYSYNNLSSVELINNGKLCLSTIDLRKNNDTIFVCSKLSKQQLDSITFLTDSTQLLIFTSNCTNLKIDPARVVSGKVYQDLNNNGRYESGEGMRGVKVELEGKSYTYSNKDGGYLLIGKKDSNVNVNIPDFKRNFLQGRTKVAFRSLTNKRTIALTGTVNTGINFEINKPELPFVTVCGRVWKDKNKSGFQDNNEGSLANVILELNGKEKIPVKPDGSYCIQVKKGEPYTLKPIKYRFHYRCGSSSYEVTYPNSGEYTNVATTDLKNIDFGIHSVVGNSQALVSLRMRKGTKPGKDFRGWMDYKIKDTLPSDCELIVNHDPYVTYKSSTIPVSEVNKDNFKWRSNSGIFKRGICMQYKFNLSDKTPANYELKWSAEFSCKDACPKDDKVSRSFRTESTSNPRFKKAIENLNNIESYHNDSLNMEVISTADSLFSYVINFQNVTGQNASHMVIIDTLSEHLDAHTVSSPFASSPYNLCITDGNILRFEFDKIELADSSESEIDSYGFIQFNVKMKPNLPTGTIIENSASIIFNHDESNLVQVAKRQNKLGDIPTGITNEMETIFSVYPNPSSGVFNIETDSKDDYTVSVYSSIGQLLFVTENVEEIDLTNYSSGIYNIKVNGSSKTVVKH